MKEFIQKLGQKFSSRKFLAAVAGIVIGVSMIAGADQATAEVIAGAVVAVLSVVSYIIIEGKIDAVRIMEAFKKVQEAVDVVKEADGDE